MIEENSSNQSKQNPEQPSGGVTSPSRPSSIDNTGGKPTNDDPGSKPKQPRKFLVEIIGDDELKPFEQETLRLARETLKLGKRQASFTIWAIGVAAIAAAFVYGQIWQATWNNQILASQSESAVVGAIETERNTRAQLKIAQTQANAAQESVKAIQRQMRQDQRAWMTISSGNTDFAKKTVESKEVLVTIPITITNTGKTPAKRVVTEIVVENVSMSKAPSFSYVVARTTDVGGAILPNAAHQIAVQPLEFVPETKEFRTKPLSDLEYQELLAGKSYMATYGRIEYKDVFGVKHWFKFCSLALLSPKNVTMAPKACADYNDVDNN
ncbi:MAG TPA: hypothetical protein VOA64_16150 [Candidatus Dormibacteraeota bacterium]|nr:hypothetical protein [Candidatus Dormibacteraeota bacterium]